MVMCKAQKSGLGPEEQSAAVHRDSHGRGCKGVLKGKVCHEKQGPLLSRQGLGHTEDNASFFCFVLFFVFFPFYFFNHRFQRL